MLRTYRIRTLLVPALVAALAIPATSQAQGGIFGRIKAKAQEKIAKKIDSTADTLTGRAVDKAAASVTCAVSNKACIAQAQRQGKPVVITDANGKKVSSADSANALASAGGAPSAAQAGAPTLHTYQNYDFVPGDSIIFDDDFRADQDGEFPANWKLVSGQGVVNQDSTGPSFVLTEGLDAVMAPRIKSPSYLGETFTIEFDYYAHENAWAGLNLYVHYPEGDRVGDGTISFDPNGVVHAWGFPGSFDVTGTYPGDASAFANKWHHGALIVKHGQLKAYVDQYRVLVAPDFPVKPSSIDFGGRADAKYPVLFRNVRIANGGGMNLIDKLTKDGRIVTHGILFDVNKAEVKPQSMGTIRQIVAMLKANPALKLEIGGHTDSDGDPAKNMTLSQARADAVKQVLVEQGIDGSRLTTKGYGATKPIASNDTPDGKANNRRVEFVKH